MQGMRKRGEKMIGICERCEKEKLIYPKIKICHSCYQYVKKKSPKYLANQKKVKKKWAKEHKDYWKEYYLKHKKVSNETQK